MCRLRSTGNPEEISFCNFKIIILILINTQYIQHIKYRHVVYNQLYNYININKYKIHTYILNVDM